MNVNDSNTKSDPISGAQENTEADLLRERLGRARSLQALTLDNEFRWMKNHETLLALVHSLRDWKSPDGVLQVKDLKWFQDLPLPEPPR